MNDIPIVHIATHNANIGDGALIHGMQYMLKKTINQSIHFINEDKWDFTNYQKKTFDDNYINWINQNAKMLIIGGGGMISSGKRSSVSGLSVPISSNMLRKLKIPPVFYAIGYNLFYNDNYNYTEKLRSTIHQVKEMGGVFSVRNDGSKERLQLLLDDSLDDVWEIPDPAVYLQTREIPIPQIRSDKYNIILQLAGDNLLNRLRQSSNLPDKLMKRIGVKRKQPNEYLLKSIVTCIKLLNERWDINIILTPHIVKDWTLYGDFINICKKESVPKLFIERNLLDSYGILRGTELAPDFFEIYRKADLVIGMRGHSSIVAVGQGTPFIGLSSHPKVKGFLNKCGLDNYCVDVKDNDLHKLLYNLANELLDDSSNWHCIRNKAIDRFYNDIKRFHKKIATLL